MRIYVKGLIFLMKVLILTDKTFFISSFIWK